MTPKRSLLLAICAVMFAGTTLQDAFACACCTSTGERSDLAMKLENSHVEEIQQVRFGKTAQLFLGEAEPDFVKGITTPSEKHDLQAVWKNDRMVFSFRDQADRSGTLTLTRPKMISIFHVDPRSRDENPNSARGPVLYKEWRLTSPAAGTEIFTPGLDQAQTLTLVLQGRGNNCTSANDFGHWMLVMWGPKAKYRFFGDLVRTP